MALIKVITSPSGQSVYATDADGSRRALLGYIGAGNTFFAARHEAEAIHKQKWGENAKRQLEDAWRGRPVP